RAYRDAMRFALVASSVPNPDSGGGAITVWSVARHLIEAGHEVVSVPVNDPGYDDAAGRTFEERLEQGRPLRPEVRPAVPRASSPRRRIAARGGRARDEELLPNLLDAPAVSEVVEEIRPDAVYAYHWDAVAATRGLRGRVPRFSMVVDLAHLPE